MYKINRNLFKENSYNVLNLNYFSNLKIFIPLSIGTNLIINCKLNIGLSTLTPTNINQINKNKIYPDTFNSNIHNKKRVRTILEYFFNSFFSSISKPVFIETPDKLILRLYFVIGTVFEYCAPHLTIDQKNNNDSNYKSTAPFLGKGTYIKKHLTEKLAQIIDYVIKNINKKAPKNKKTKTKSKRKVILCYRF